MRQERAKNRETPTYIGIVGRCVFILSLFVSLTFVKLFSAHPPSLVFRIGGSDVGGAEATEGFRSRAEEAVQGDEGAGSETPPQDQRADQRAHGACV